MSTEPNAAPLSELLSEGGEFVINDISGGAKARYVRVYFATFYRFVDVTAEVMLLLDLPLVRADGMHTAAIWGTDAELVARIAKAVNAREPAAPPPPPPEDEQGPSGGKRVRSKRPAPSRPPRGGAAVPTK